MNLPIGFARIDLAQRVRLSGVSKAGIAPADGTQVSPSEFMMAAL
jgi:hypothetical protein